MDMICFSICPSRFSCRLSCQNANHDSSIGVTLSPATYDVRGSCKVLALSALSVDLAPLTIKDMVITTEARRRILMLQVRGRRGGGERM